MSTIIVPGEEAGKRLDIFLTGRTREPRTHIQKAIKADRVSVNGRIAIAHQLTRVNDVVRIAPDEKREEVAVIASPVIIAETDDYLVIEKPVGLLSHGKPNSDEESVASWARRYDPDIVRVGELARPGIIHRLDRNISGLMVVARTPEMFERLKEQFQHHQVLKVYTALVLGAPKTDEGMIRFTIARSARGGRMAARPLGAEGKDAATQFTVVRKFRTTTLLSVRILTGRTHQIRAHLLAYGLPVVGDTLYSGHVKNVALPPLDRPFLHATRLGFEDRQGAWCEFTSPLPPDLAQYLERLKTL